MWVGIKSQGHLQTNELLRGKFVDSWVLEKLLKNLFDGFIVGVNKEKKFEE